MEVTISSASTISGVMIFQGGGANACVIALLNFLLFGYTAYVLAS